MRTNHPEEAWSQGKKFISQARKQNEVILRMNLEVLEVAAVVFFIEPELLHQCGLEMAAATRRPTDDATRF